MSTDAAETWNRIQSALRHRVSDGTYELWLARLELVGITGDVVAITAPDTVRSWVADRFTGDLHAAAQAVLGPSARVELGGGEAPLPARGRRRGAPAMAEPPPGS